MASEEIAKIAEDFEDEVEDVKASSGGVAFAVVLEAPKAEEPPPEIVVALQKTAGGSPRDKEEINSKLARAEERRREFLESKLEAVRTDEDRRAEVLAKQREEELKFIQQTKKKLETDWEVVNQNIEAKKKLFEQSCKEREARIEEVLGKRASLTGA